MDAIKNSFPSEIARNFDRDGFCFLIQAMSRERAARYRSMLERVEEREFKSCEEEAVFYGSANYVLPWMDEITRLPTIVDVVQSILGPNLLVWEASLVIKEARTPNFISWHQDLTYWGLGGSSEITAWVALSPATVESGCMRFALGSHLEGIVKHHDTFGDENMLSRG